MVNAAVAAGASERKLRLFVIACCRRVWHLLPDDRYREAVEIAGRFCDGLATRGELSRARDASADLFDPWFALRRRSVRTQRERAPFWAYESAATASEPKPLATPISSTSGLRSTIGRYQPGNNVAVEGADCAAAAAACAATHDGESEPDGRALAAERAVQCDLLRDILGTAQGPPASIDSAWLAWHDGAVSQLARAAYEDRRLPEGHLDPARLAVLADALEDAGCADADLLGHLREPGPHVRGCWAVDLILGKGVGRDRGGVA
jgi:hypothetical protein